MKYPKQLSDTIECLCRLPGVGEKTALRHVLSLLRWQSTDLHFFCEAIKGLTKITRCGECGVIVDQNTQLCEICQSDVRSSLKTICVVEGLAEFMAIEKTASYKGLFHILGGVLNPLAGIGPDHLTIDKLLLRIKNKGIENVILALNPSVEGDVTCSYIKELVPTGVKVERLGLGIPMGGSLEFLDVLTINKAMENRRSL